jgi:hypothetical protein
MISLYKWHCPPQLATCGFNYPWLIFLANIPKRYPKNWFQHWCLTSFPVLEALAWGQTSSQFGLGMATRKRIPNCQLSTGCSFARAPLWRSSSKNHSSRSCAWDLAVLREEQAEGATISRCNFNPAKFMRIYWGYDGI